MPYRLLVDSEPIQFAPMERRERLTRLARLVAEGLGIAAIEALSALGLYPRRRSVRHTYAFAEKVFVRAAHLAVGQPDAPNPGEVLHHAFVVCGVHTTEQEALAMELRAAESSEFAEVTEVVRETLRQVEQVVDTGSARTRAIMLHKASQDLLQAAVAVKHTVEADPEVAPPVNDLLTTSVSLYERTA